MPFESDKQRKFLWSQMPEVAKQIAYHNLGGAVGFRSRPAQPTSYQPTQPYGTPYRAPTPPKPAPAPLAPAPVQKKNPYSYADNFADHGGPDGGANSQGNEGGGGGGGGGGK